MALNLPPYLSFPELTSERVLLRELKPEELSEVLEIMTYDGKTAKNLGEGEIVRLTIEKCTSLT